MSMSHRLGLTMSLISCELVSSGFDPFRVLIKAATALLIESLSGKSFSKALESGSLGS